MSWVPRFEIQRWVGRRWTFDADGWTTGTYTVPAPAAVTTPKARTLTLSKTFLMLVTPKNDGRLKPNVLVRQTPCRTNFWTFYTRLQMMQSHIELRISLRADPEDQGAPHVAVAGRPQRREPGWRRGQERLEERAHDRHLRLVHHHVSGAVAAAIGQEPVERRPRREDVAAVGVDGDGRVLRHDLRVRRAVDLEPQPRLLVAEIRGGYPVPPDLHVDPKHGTSERQIPGGRCHQPKAPHRQSPEENLKHRRRPDQQSRKSRREEPLLNVESEEGGNRSDRRHEQDLPLQTLPAPRPPKQPPRRGHQQQGGEDLRSEAAFQHVPKIAQEAAGSFRGLYRARARIAALIAGV